MTPTALEEMIRCGRDHLSTLDRSFFPPKRADAIYLAIAEQMAKAHSRVRFFKSVPHYYDAGCWLETDSDTVRGLIIRTVPPLYGDDRTSERIYQTWMLSHNQSDSELASFHCRNNGGSILLNCSNGVVEVHSNGLIELKSHDPDLQFAAKIDTAYLDDSRLTPSVAKLITEAVADPKDRQSIYWMCAYLLCPDCRFGVALVLRGDTNTGKTTIADFLTAVMGPPIVSHLSLDQICKPESYHIADLRFKALNIANELDAREYDTSILKKLIRGEAMNARRPYERPFLLQTTCKYLFTLNELPLFRKADNAIVDRLMMLRFGQTSAIELDRNLLAKLCREREPFFRDMVQLLPILLNAQSFPSYGESGLISREQFKDRHLDVSAFLEERCAVHKKGSGLFCTNSEIIAAMGEFWDMDPLNDVQHRHLLERKVQDLRSLRDEFAEKPVRKWIAKIGRQVRIVRNLELIEPPEQDIAV
jgi:hypothetical protein